MWLNTGLHWKTTKIRITHVLVYPKQVYGIPQNGGLFLLWYRCSLCSQSLSMNNPKYEVIRTGYNVLTAFKCGFAKFGNIAQLRWTVVIFDRRVPRHAQRGAVVVLATVMSHYKTTLAFAQYVKRVRPSRHGRFGGLKRASGSGSGGSGVALRTSPIGHATFQLFHRKNSTSPSLRRHSVKQRSAATLPILKAAVPA